MDKIGLKDSGLIVLINIFMKSGEENFGFNHLNNVQTFDFIKNLVRDKNTFFRKAIPLKKRVAVAL